MSILALSEVRPMEPGDYNFVLSSFAHSFRPSKYAGTTPANHWHATAKLTIDVLLSRGAITEILCNSEDRDQIIGWILHETASSKVPVIHYVYIKDDFRSEPGIPGGLAKHLVERVASGKRYIYTHRTREAHPPRGVHDPDIAKRKSLDPVRPI